MIDLPRSRALVAYDRNGYLLPVQPVTPPNSKLWRLLHRSPVLLLIGAWLFLITIFASDVVTFVLHKVGLGRRGFYMIPIVGALIVMTSYFIFVRVVERRPQVEEFALSDFVRESAIYSSAGVGLSVLAAAAACAVGDGRFLRIDLSAALLSALVLAVCGAVVQEVVLRGEIFRLIERLVGSWIALAVSVAGLGIVQLTNSNSTLSSLAATLFQNGLFFTAAFIATRRLWAGIGLHVGLTIAPLIIRLDLVGAGGISGGAVDPTRTWPGVAVIAIAGVGLLWRGSRLARIVAPAWTRHKLSSRRQKWAAGLG